MIEDFSLPDDVNIPKNIDKWIQVEKLIYRIKEEDVKKAGNFIKRNYSIDPDAVLFIICNAYEYVPQRIEALKALFKEIGVVSQIFRTNELTLNFYKEGLIKEDSIENPLNILKPTLFKLEEESVFSYIAKDDVEKVTFLSSQHPA